jgi:hypothetical protein
MDGLLELPGATVEDFGLVEISGERTTPRSRFSLAHNDRDGYPSGKQRSTAMPYKKDHTDEHVCFLLRWLQGY